MPECGTAIELLAFPFGSEVGMITILLASLRIGPRRQNMTVRSGTVPSVHISRRQGNRIQTGNLGTVGDASAFCIEIGPASAASPACHAGKVVIDMHEFCGFALHELANGCRALAVPVTSRDIVCNTNKFRRSPLMSEEYVPPKVWTWDKANGGAFASVNRPIAGPTSERELPVGKHPFQVYSLGTPNGQKATIMLEELLQMGFSEAEYDAWLIKIFDGDQFTTGFVDINPNSKIPAMVDRSGPEPFRVFESGAILMHLAEKFGVLLPTSGQARAECLSWLFLQFC